jgi:hypothetical protein
MQSDDPSNDNYEQLCQTTLQYQEFKDIHTKIYGNHKICIVWDGESDIHFDSAFTIASNRNNIEINTLSICRNFTNHSFIMRDPEKIMPNLVYNKFIPIIYRGLDWPISPRPRDPDDNDDEDTIEYTNPRLKLVRILREETQPFTLLATSGLTRIALALLELQKILDLESNRTDIETESRLNIINEIVLCHGIKWENISDNAKIFLEGKRCLSSLITDETRKYLQDKINIGILQSMIIMGGASPESDQSAFSMELDYRFERDPIATNMVFTLFRELNENKGANDQTFFISIIPLNTSNKILISQNNFIKPLLTADRHTRHCLGIINDPHQPMSLARWIAIFYKSLIHKDVDDLYFTSQGGSRFLPYSINDEISIMALSNPDLFTCIIKSIRIDNSIGDNFQDNILRTSSSKSQLNAGNIIILDIPESKRPLLIQDIVNTIIQKSNKLLSLECVSLNFSYRHIFTKYERHNFTSNTNNSMSKLIERIEINITKPKIIISGIYYYEHEFKKKIAYALRKNNSIDSISISAIMNVRMGYGPIIIDRAAEDKIIKKFAKTLCINTTLTELHYGGVPAMSDEGLRHLGSALEKNTTLLSLGIQYNRCENSNGVRHVVAALKINTQILFITGISNSDAIKKELNEIDCHLKLNRSYLSFRVSYLYLLPHLTPSNSAKPETSLSDLPFDIRFKIIRMMIPKNLYNHSLDKYLKAKLTFFKSRDNQPALLSDNRIENDFTTAVTHYKKIE